MRRGDAGSRPPDLLLAWSKLLELLVCGVVSGLVSYDEEKLPNLGSDVGALCSNPSRILRCKIHVASLGSGSSSTSVIQMQSSPFMIMSP